MTIKLEVCLSRKPTTRRLISLLLASDIFFVFPISDH